MGLHYLFLPLGIAMYAQRARKLGARDEAIDKWMLESLFSTMTNVNFDDSRFVVFLATVETYTSFLSIITLNRTYIY